MNHTADVLVIGSGAAGLTLALGIADKAKVIVLSKENACAGSTNYAQGGIAGVYNIKDDDDSIAAHVKDTCIAGGFLCDEKTVDYVAKMHMTPFSGLSMQAFHLIPRKRL